MEQHLQTFVQLAQQSGLIGSSDDTDNRPYDTAWQVVEAARRKASNTEQDAHRDACAAYAPLLSDDALHNQVLRNVQVAITYTALSCRLPRCGTHTLS